MRSLLLLLGILLLSVSCTATNMKVILKTDKSDIKTVVPNKDDSEELLSSLTELIKKTDDMLKVYLSSDRIERIKKNEQYIEFLFDSKVEVSSDMFGNYNINKVLIPLTGTFGVSNSSEMTTIILGDDDGYISGPLRNSNGNMLIQKMKQLLEK